MRNIIRRRRQPRRHDSRTPMVTLAQAVEVLSTRLPFTLERPSGTKLAGPLPQLRLAPVVTSPH